MKMLNYDFNKHEKIIVSAIVFAMIFISFATNYYGSTDIGDYTDVGLYLAGEYPADIRGSHSYLYGAMHSPFLKIFEGLWIFKLTSLLSLLGIVYSVYIITNRNKKALWLTLLSPIIWYMAPWANPLQLSALLLLWAWYFIKKFDEERKISLLVYSGILLGMGWAIWDSILFFGVLLAIPFMFNKKMWESLILAISIIVGLSPRLILDQVLFNFPFYTIIKSFMGTLANLSGGIYARTSGHSGANLIVLILTLLIIPILFWSKLVDRRFLIKEGKTLIFLGLSSLLLLTNLQIRYLIVLLPIILVMCSDNIEYRKFKIAVIMSAIVTILFISPYIIQIDYTFDDKPFGVEISYISDKIISGEGIIIEKGDIQEEIRDSLKEISKKYPGERYVVATAPDDYALLASLSNSLNISRFVSIQDYSLWGINKSELYSKRFSPIPNIDDRRQIWIEGGMDRNIRLERDYPEINYMLSFDRDLNVSEFNYLESFNRVYVFKKI